MFKLHFAETQVFVANPRKPGLSGYCERSKKQRFRLMLLKYFSELFRLPALFDFFQLIPGKRGHCLILRNKDFRMTKLHF